MVEQRQVDVAVAVLVASIVAVGVVTAVQLFVAGDSVSGDAASMPPAMRVVGPVFMSLVIASVVSGVYLYARKQVFPAATRAAQADSDSGASAGTGEHEPPEDAVERATEAESEGEDAEQSSSRDVLDVLPEDEHRILEPVLESPGLTQIEVRDRSGYSKSKVSQTISGLEERGLLYREAQGRTYRVYPADDLDERL